MKHRMAKLCRFFLQAVFDLGVVLILIVSLPQMFLHVEKGGYSHEKIAIEPILRHYPLSENDYSLIFKQTGLGKCSVDQLRERKNYKKEDILRFQEALFATPERECRRTSLITRQDRIKDHQEFAAPMVPVENGDILLSFSSHTAGWRHGHAGLVLDADRGTCLEAVVLGQPSQLKQITHWNQYTGFTVLRLKGAGEKERKAVADYAEQHLQDVPYGLTSGFFDRKLSQCGDLTAAQCAYLVWYAFSQFGYNLDSDGGRLVTVKDLAQSSQLEVVQVFGTDLKEFDRF